MSEPERAAASTTIVSVESAAMMRLRAGKHQRWPPKPGGISETTAPRSIRLRWRWRMRAGYAVSAPPARTATGGARAWRPSLERAEVRGGVDPERHAGDDGHAGAGQRAAERARDLEAVGRRAAGADDRDRLAGRERGGRAGDVEDRRRVGELAQALGVAGSQRQTAVRPAAAMRRRAKAALNAS